MIPIHKLLNRVKWDENFGRGKFEIGYWDRVQNTIILVPFEQLILDPHNHLSFRVVDTEGIIRSIPFHRVHVVYKDGILIWKRYPSSQTNARRSTGEV